MESNKNVAQRLVFNALMTLAMVFTIYSFYRYTFDNFALQIVLILMLVIVKISSQKIYDTLHIDFDIPIIILSFYAFYDYILAIPIVIFFISNLLQRLIASEFTNLKYNLSVVAISMIPLICSALAVGMFNNPSIADIWLIVITTVLVYTSLNMLLVHLTLIVEKNLRLLNILHPRWILLYFILQCFCSIIAIKMYLIFDLLGFLIAYSISVYVVKTLNKSITIEKHQEVYKETIEYFVDLYDYGILILDEKLEVLSVNQPFIKANKLPDKKIVGMNFKNISSQFTYGSEIMKLLEKMKDNNTFTEKILISGERQFSLLSHSTATGYQGKFIFLLKDITVKRLRNIQYITQKKLESIEELAAGTANDIKNPLTVAQGFLQLLKLHLSEPKNIYYADQALKAITDTDDYIELFTLMGNPSKDHHNYTDFNLTDLMRDIISETQKDLISKDVILKSNLQDNIIIHGKKSLLHKAISFVIKNAIEAIETQGEINFYLKATEFSVILEISDNGTGIKEKDLIKVFDPYFTTKTNGSRGLGLFYCKKILDQHSGTISLKSTEDRGTKVIIKINKSK